MIIKFSGNLGDAVYTLCLIRNLGGKHDLVLCDNEIHPLMPYPFLKLAPVITPLIEAQPYVKSLKVGNHPADIDLCAFRHHIDRTKTLLHAQTVEAERILGGTLSRSTTPWLSCGDHSYSYDRIIVARSARYHNPYFPWAEFVNRNLDRILFIGTRAEHHTFSQEFGPVEFYYPKDLLEAAELIKTAGIFVGNQSSPHAVAMGLGVDIIQETSPVVPDCVYHRANVKYVTCRGFQFEGNHYGDQVVKCEDVREDQCPPGQWQYQGERCLSLSDFVEMLHKRDKSVDKLQIRRNIVKANISRVKDYFMPQSEALDHTAWQQAFENAGITPQ